MIPTRVASIWIDCSCIESLGGGKIRATTKCRPRGYRRASADTVGTPLDSTNLFLYFEGLETTSISSEESPSEEQIQRHNLCTRLI